MNNGVRAGPAGTTGVLRHSLYEVRLGISFFLFEDESNGLSVLRERGDWCHVDEEI